jgi:formamidopyrimidine-DNA glycosylase
MEGLPRTAKLREILIRRRAPLKAVLLDQGVFAGVGNWIADEVLFQARLSPHRSAASLSVDEVARLRSRLLAIVRKAVDVEADYHRYPASWLFHHRWGKRKDAATAGRHRIIHDVIGGRTTAWVPGLQK